MLNLPGAREKRVAEARLAARSRARRARRLVYMAMAAWGALIGAAFVIVRLIETVLGW